MAFGKTFRTAALALALILSAGTFRAGLVPANAEPAENGTQTAAELSQNDIFIEYSKKYPQAFPDAEIIVSDSSVPLEEGSVFETEIEVGEAGYYVLEIDYTADDTVKTEPTFSLSLNGSTPYFEASRLSLPLIFRDETPVSREQTEIPRQVYLCEKQTAILFDSVGYYGGMLWFYLELGKNSVRLDCLSGKFEMSGLRFKHYSAAPEYKSAEKDFKLKEYKGGEITLEAEAASKKSNSSVYAANDASSAAVSPSSPYEKYLNTLGGSSWSAPGQYIEWEISVPEDALYSISFKYRQSDNAGLNSYRRITVDGAVPFSELEEYAFAYTSTFENEILSDGGEKMLFPLSAGSHIIRMQVVIGELSQILPYVNNIINSLTDAYRQIVMITGSVPDTLRDYKLESSVPGALETIAAQKKLLDGINEQLKKISGGSSSGTKAMSSLSKQLASFIDDSYNITQQLQSFKSNIASLSTWMLTAKSQPLKLDTLSVFSPNGKIKTAKASFGKTVIFNIKAFLFTFSSEYEQNSLNSSDSDTITVWTTGGTTPYAIMQQLINDELHKTYPDMKVNLRLVGASLVTAVISGKGPDISIGVDTTEIMNYAYRNALVDLNRFEDSEEVFSRFRKSALVPVSYESSVYAVPETQSFPVMYYRTDIFKEMQLSPPADWKQVIYVMSILKKNNIEFGIPFDSSVFINMIYQNGGTLYNKEQTATALKESAAIEAFTQFTSFFTDYSAPLAFDAQNRFRTGEMPILISDISLYNTLSVIAPEIDGKWDIAAYPGTVLPDGEINNCVNAGVTGDVVFSKQRADICWDFLKWWTGAEIQATYNERLEMALGQSARRFSANTEALYKINWSRNILELFEQYESRMFGVPGVPGSYFTGRHLKNAISRVVYSGDVPGDALMQYAETIDAEIELKREEFGLDGKNGKE